MTVPRERLAAGEVGSISITQKNGKTIARCRACTQDGDIKFVQVTIHKDTKAAVSQARKQCHENALEKAKLNATEGNVTRESKLNALIDEWEQGEWVRVKNGEITEATLAAYLRTADFIRHGKPGAKNSGRRGEAIGAKLKLRECTTQRLQNYVLETAGPHYTVHRDLTRILKAVFNRGLELGVVEHNPAAHIRHPHVPKKNTTALTPDEVMELRQLLRDYENGGSNRIDPETGKRKGGRPRERYLADLVDIMLATGTRIGEVLALRWEDIDLTVDPSMHTADVEITGTAKTREADPEAGISYLYRQDHPKTARSHRIITVPKFAVDILLRLQVQAGDSPFVFTTREGTMRAPNNVRKALRKACGTDFEGLTPHTLRRTVATIVAEKHGIEAASRLLGHADISITDRAYIRPGLRAPDVSSVLEGLGVPLADVVRVSQASPSTRVSESA